MIKAVVIEPDRAIASGSWANLVAGKTDRNSAVGRTSAKEMPSIRGTGAAGCRRNAAASVGLAGRGDMSVAELAVPHVMALLDRDGLIQTDPVGHDAPPDLTREPMELPASRAVRLQASTRGDAGFILSMAHSTQRGYGRTDALVGELRIGRVAVEMGIL